MNEGTKGEGHEKEKERNRFHTGASGAYPAKDYSLQPLWSTWLAVAIPSLLSKHEGRGGHRDHCLCFSKTLFVELSSEADLPVRCSFVNCIPDLVSGDTGDRFPGLPLGGHFYWSAPADKTEWLPLPRGLEGIACGESI